MHIYSTFELFLRYSLNMKTDKDMLLKIILHSPTIFIFCTYLMTLADNILNHLTCKGCFIAFADPVQFLVQACSLGVMLWEPAIEHTLQCEDLMPNPTHFPVFSPMREACPIKKCNI